MGLDPKSERENVKNQIKVHQRALDKILKPVNAINTNLARQLLRTLNNLSLAGLLGCNGLLVLKRVDLASRREQESVTEVHITDHVRAKMKRCEPVVEKRVNQAVIRIHQALPNRSGALGEVGLPVQKHVTAGKKFVNVFV